MTLHVGFRVSKITENDALYSPHCTFIFLHICVGVMEMQRLGRHKELKNVFIH